MAYKTVSNLKDSVSGMLQGLNLDNVVTNLYGAFERAARQTCVLLDIPEAQLKSNLTLYDGVYDYALPSNMFATAITDVRPWAVERDTLDGVRKQNPMDFDMGKGWVPVGYKVSFEFSKGVGVMRVVSSLPTPKLELDAMTDDTGWIVDGSVATSLVEDAATYYQTPASLRFQLASGTGTLTKSITSNDLTDYQSVGVVFLAIYVPIVTNLTSITLRLGSSASDYYSVAATTGFLKAFTAGEWMLVAFDLSGATITGSPTITAIDYAQIRIATSGSIANFRTGSLFISLPSPHQVLYQTSAIFLPSGSTTPSNTITNDADQVQLNDSALTIYEVMCAREVSKQQGGTLNNGVVATFDQDLNGAPNKMGLVQAYRADNPSQELRESTSYYDL